MIEGYYKGLSGIYFNRAIDTIIKIGNLKKTNKIILDFGCGLGVLKKKLKSKSNIVNYDKNTKFSEIKNWKNIKFEIFVSNQVFYQFSEKKLETIIKEIKKKNPKTLFIIGISKRSLLNKIGKFLLFKFTAHKNTILTYKKELFILTKYLKIIKKTNVLLLSDIYLMKFK